MAAAVDTAVEVVVAMEAVAVEGNYYFLPVLDLFSVILLIETCLHKFNLYTSLMENDLVKRLG